MKNPLLLAAVLCGCLMASVASAEATGHKGPGFQFMGGKLKLIPTVNVGAFWESNARDTAHNEESGGGWRVQPTLSLSYDMRRTNLGVNGFYTMERGFESKDAQDSDSYGVNIGLRHELSERWNLTLSTSYSRSENDEFYGDTWNNNTWNPYGLSRIDENRQETYNANLALGYRSEKWQASFGAGWHRSKQLDGWKQTSDSYNASVMLGRAIGPHTYWNVSLSMSMDDPEYGNTSESYYLMTGASGELSKRFSYSAMAGLGIYDYSGYYGETEFGPSYDISGAYKLSRKVALSLALSSRYEPEYNGDSKAYYVWSHNLTGAVNVQWCEVLSSRFNTAIMYEEHTSPDNWRGSRDYERTYLQFAFNTYYKFNDYASLNAGVSWKTDMYSGDRDDKDDLRADIGLTYSF